MPKQALAILWAQWRTGLNYMGAKRSGMTFPTIVLIFWYSAWLFGAVSLCMIASDPIELPTLRQVGPSALLLCFLYWQVIPLMMVSTGSSLELRKLRPYPIPHSQLFLIEVLLRVTTGGEMLILLGGLGAGLLRNSAVPLWAPFFLLPFVVLNMLLSAAFRDLFGRLLARKRIRELLALFFVLLAALPQLLISTRVPAPVRRVFALTPLKIWPWSSTSELSLGTFTWTAFTVIVVWLAIAAYFGMRQFERSLRFDVDAAQATDARPDRKSFGFAEAFYSFPNRFLRDPLAAIVEKELRSLSRTPRFRLVFTMGFSFGLLIWLPMIHGGNNHSFPARNFLAFVSLYALMLLGEVSFWNSFGFDRSAVQAYYVTPVPISTVLVAKNISTAIFVFLEISMVCLICFLFRFTVPFNKIIEAYAVATVMALFLMAMGNLGSVRGPRPTNPAQAWRSGASRVQAMLLIVYPTAVLPIGLAFLARHAYETDLAFYGVLAVDLLIGAIVYSIALESASAYATASREKIISTLAQSDGPIA